MFVTGPDVVKATTGEDVSFEISGGAALHNFQSGVALSGRRRGRRPRLRTGAPDISALELQRASAALGPREGPEDAARRPPLLL